MIQPVLCISLALESFRSRLHFGSTMVKMIFLSV